MKKCKFTSVAKIRYLLAALLFLTGVTSVYAAQVSVLREDCSTVIIIRGAIQVNDDKRLLGAIADIANRRKLAKCPGTGGILGSKIVVWLDSEGGDVDVALDMGRIIRREKGFVMVHFDSKCFSSCVFLLAAGVQRMTIGDVGIHRPYFSALSNADDVSVVRAKREAINKRIRAYFDEMDIPQGLLDLMLSIPPGEIKILSKTELVSFRLSGDDPTHDEMETAQSAYQYNTTSAEFRKRAASSSAKCGTYSLAASSEAEERRYLCSQATLLNISVQEVQERRNKFRAVCLKISDKERLEQCFREIYILGK